MKSTIASMLTRAAAVATLTAMMFASAGLAHASAINSNRHKAQSGTLNITAPTQVGAVTLQPGSYEVKARNRGGSSIIEFARWNYNPYAQEGLPVWEREVVATVSALPQALASAATRTSLLASSDKARTTALEIRGDAVNYIF
jgi:hypothetical protein